MFHLGFECGFGFDVRFGFYIVFRFRFSFEIGFEFEFSGSDLSLIWCLDSGLGSETDSFSGCISRSG